MAASAIDMVAAYSAGSSVTTSAQPVALTSSASRLPVPTVMAMDHFAPQHRCATCATCALHRPVPAIQGQPAQLSVYGTPYMARAGLAQAPVVVPQLAANFAGGWGTSAYTFRADPLPTSYESGGIAPGLGSSLPSGSRSTTYGSAMPDGNFSVFATPVPTSASTCTHMQGLSSVPPSIVEQANRAAEVAKSASEAAELDDEVSQLLAQLNFSLYVEAFRTNGFDSMVSVLGMEREHMERIGMLPGHIVKLEWAIAQMRSFQTGASPGQHWKAINAPTYSKVALMAPPSPPPIILRDALTNHSMSISEHLGTPPVPHAADASSGRPPQLPPAHGQSVSADVVASHGASAVSVPARERSSPAGEGTMTPAVAVGPQARPPPPASPEESPEASLQASPDVSPHSQSMENLALVPGQQVVRQQPMLPPPRQVFVGGATSPVATDPGPAAGAVPPGVMVIASPTGLVSFGGARVFTPQGAVVTTGGSVSFGMNYPPASTPRTAEPRNPPTALQPMITTVVSPSSRATYVRPCLSPTDSAYTRGSSSIAGMQSSWVIQREKTLAANQARKQLNLALNTMTGSVAGDRALTSWLRSHEFYNVNSEKRGLLKTTYPLHTAVEENDVSMVKLLLFAGAQYTKTDSSGRTPIQLAERRNKKGSHQKIIDVLMRAPEHRHRQASAPSVATSDAPSRAPSTSTMA